MYKLAVILLTLAVLLTSCSSPSTGSEDILKLGITPNLAFFQPEVYSCAAELPGHVQMEMLPLNALVSGAYSAIIHVGQFPQDETFSTRIGSVKLVVILNPENSLSQLDPDDLAKILLGIQTDWQEVAPQSFTTASPIHVWSYPQGDDARGLVEENLLSGRSITPASHLAPDRQAMLEAILGDPTAIGYILESTTPSTGDATQVEPKIVYSVDQPILTSFLAEPEGAIKALVKCLSE
jgi:hypothetical protein